MLLARKTLSTQFNVNSLFFKRFNSTLSSTVNINANTNFNKNSSLPLFSSSAPSFTYNFPHYKIITHNKKWNYEEDNILLRRVIRYGWKHWGIISQGFPNRSSLDCYYRYRNNLKYLIDYSFICSINQSSIMSLTSKEQQQFWKKLSKTNDLLLKKNKQLRTKSLSLLKQYYINMQKFSKEQQQLLPINYNLVLQTSKKINNEESLFVTKNKPWTNDEIEKLKYLLTNYASLDNQLFFSHDGKNIMYNWKLISSNHFPDRTLNDVKDKWHNIKLRLPWTKQEDQIIADGVKQFGEQWDKIASTINSSITTLTTSSSDSTFLLNSVRSSSQCMVRWRDVLKPLQSKQKKFSEFEHLTLKKALIEVPLLKGNRINWKFIHQNYFPNRTPTQLYKHYYNVICKPARWNLQEDELLLKITKEYYQTFQETQRGSFSLSFDDNDGVWKQIARHIPGRTAIQCRNRYLNKLDPSLKKGRYTVEDQFQLFMSIKKNGHRWSLVAKELGRSKVAVAKLYSIWKYRNQFAYARKRKGGINSIYGKLLSHI